MFASMCHEVISTTEQKAKATTQAGIKKEMFHSKSLVLQFSMLQEHGLLKQEEEQLTTSSSSSSSSSENADGVPSGHEDPGDHSVRGYSRVYHQNTFDEEFPSLGLRLSVESSLFYIICSSTDVYVASPNGQNLCDELLLTRRSLSPSRLRSSRLLAVDETTRTIITAKEDIEVRRQYANRDATLQIYPELPLYNYYYYEWQLSFPVLAIGKIFDQEIFSEILRNKERDIQSALDFWIVDGRFESMLRTDGHDDIISISILGQEDFTFPPAIHALDLTSTSSTGSNISSGSAILLDEETDRIGYTETLNPSPLHAIRAAGIILFAGTIVFTSIIMYVASQRKKEREKQEEAKAVCCERVKKSGGAKGYVL